VGGLACQLFGQKRARVGAPREALVLEQRGERGGRMRKSRRRIAKRFEAATQRGSALGAVELVGESGDRSAVEHESELGIASGREQKQRTPSRPVQLVLADLDLPARQKRERRPQVCLFLRTRAQAL